MAHQAPLSMEFSRQEYSNGLPFPPSGNLPDPGMEPVSLVSSVLASGFFTSVPPGKPYFTFYFYVTYFHFTQKKIISITLTAV